MTRIVMIATVLLSASALSANVFLEYDDSRFLRSYETVRYRVELDYGLASQVRINIFVRGRDNSPRVRVRDSDKDVLTNREDNGGDNILDFYFMARQSRDDVFFIDVTHKYADLSGRVEVTLQLDAEPESGADGFISFNKMYFDYNRPEDRNEDACSARGGGGAGALLLLGAAAGSALWFRRRRDAA